MKKFCITSLKLTALALIALSSFLALAAQYGDNQWDPIQEIQQLRNQHRRDDAIDLVKFLNQNQHNDDELSIFEKKVAYNSMERAKAFVWDGAIKGQVNDSYSGIGALAADFCLYGDIRDVTVQTFNLLFDQENFDGVISVLSGAGIALSTMPLFDGMYAMNKNTAKYVSRHSRPYEQRHAQIISVRPYTTGTIQRYLRPTKKNGWSIPRTASCLSNIHNPTNLKHAADLISRHKRTGNVSINTAGDTGLSLYATTPKSLKQPLIDAFKRNPKAFIGIFRSHLIVHSIKH